MLRSIAARSEHRHFHEHRSLRCVWKHGAAIASRLLPTCAPQVPISGKPEIGCLRDARANVGSAGRRLITRAPQDEDGRQGSESAHAWWPVAHHAGGIGNTGLAEAKPAGKITWISLSSTWVLTGAAPWFWPLTNFVGP